MTTRAQFKKKDKTGGLRRKAYSLSRQPRFVKLWLPALWIFLGLSRWMILTFSFRRLAPHLGHPMGVSSYTPLLTPTQTANAARVGQAIRLASRYTPWISNCFPQAITARLLLSAYRIPYTLYFGMLRDAENGKYQAHAWVVAGPVAVTGGRSFDRFTVVGCYVSPRPV